MNQPNQPNQPGGANQPSHSGVPAERHLSGDAWSEVPEDAHASSLYPHGAPGFDRLWAPHRMAYLADARQRNEAATAAGSDPTCPFCAAPHGSEDAEDSLMVARGSYAYVVLNLFPYNPGHLLVCPYRHVGNYVELTADELADISALTQTALAAHDRAGRPQGFNIGINQGPIAGTSVPTHVHQHVVPRWGGDANFLPIIAHTKPLPEVLGQTRQRLRQAWAEVAPDQVCGSH